MVWVYCGAPICRPRDEPKPLHPQLSDHALVSIDRYASADKRWFLAGTRIPLGFAMVEALHQACPETLSQVVNALLRDAVRRYLMPDPPLTFKGQPLYYLECEVAGFPVVTPNRRCTGSFSYQA